jgi:hypothetical protein
MGIRLILTSARHFPDPLDALTIRLQVEKDEA